MAIAEINLVQRLEGCEHHNARVTRIRQIKTLAILAIIKLLLPFNCLSHTYVGRMHVRSAYRVLLQKRLIAAHGVFFILHELSGRAHAAKVRFTRSVHSGQFRLLNSRLCARTLRGLINCNESLTPHSFTPRL